MADLYSVADGLTPTAQEILQAELFVQQVLAAQYPDLDLREGTGLRDLVIRPSAMLFALAKKATDLYFSQNTLQGVDDVTPQDMVDSILSNWFLTRNIGIQSIINARLYFASRKNVSVSSDVYFSTDNTLRFFPSTSLSAPASALTYDSYSDEYYIDIDMTAEKEGADYNIGSGSLLYFANFDPYFLRAEINYLKEASISTETNLEFIDRAETAISTRNLINVPSVDSNLRATFNYIKRLVTIGMGDPEMIRDQLKAVFDDEDPRSITSLSSTGTTATAVLADHGFNTGQRVTITDALPTTYNGTYIITVTDASTFTYTISTTAGPATTIATVQAVNLPVLIHNGGMMDIYCSESLASSITQLTTDQFGKAVLTGPVYSFDRSSVSGGAEADTIPYENMSTVSSMSIVSTTVTAATAAPHAFSVGDTVTIGGAVQLQTLTSLSSVGLSATATLAGHGYQVGNSVVIAGATQTSYNGTFIITSVTSSTFSFNLAIATTSPATGTITASVNLINGDHVITAGSGSSFEFVISQVSAVAVTGTISASSPVHYEVSNTYDQVKTIDNITSIDTEATVTMTHHGYVAGRYVKIEGVTPSGYNGSWLINEVINIDQFTFTLPAPVTGSFSGGTSTFVVPWYDYGFSERQSLVIDFGTGNANQTASFNINYFQNLDSIQSYLEDSTNRVLCADPLARGLNFYLLDVKVVAYGGTVPNTAQLTSIISDYLSTLDVGGTFVMTDMVAKLRLNEITNIQNPPLVTFHKYTRDLNPVTSGIITDILDPNDRTSVFIIGNVEAGTLIVPQTNTPVIS